jgi:hypothetical protein
MNMISTGAFQTEMNASNKQPTLAEKFAAVWEKKNAKAARAGGVSLMALSLAACGSDDATTTTTAATTTTTTTTTTEETPAAGGSFDLTPLVDIASSTQALTGSLASSFRFTDGNETITGMSATMANTDTLLDPSSTDADVLNVTVTAATTITTSNIETVNISYAVADQTFTGSNIGTTAYNVSGAVAGKLATPTSGATITLDGYSRVLELDALVLTGTTAAGSAETISVALSGATHGSTAATQSGVAIDATGNDNLETLNIASNGAAANAFTLSVIDSETVGKVVTSGDQDLTIRFAEALLDGKTIDGTASTGEVNLSMATGGGITTNAANWSGVDNIVYRDADATAGAATLNSVTSGQNVEVANSVTTLTVSTKGAAYSLMADAASLQLNGSSTTAGVTVTTYDAQNAKALSLASEGLASSTAATAANTISNLDGDFTTITITGDTSLAITDLDIEAVQTATTATTARAVVVDASAMTGNAFLSTTASADAKVSYTITGTLGADTIVANNSGSTLSGGAGADTLTGGNGVDTISGGAGADHIDASFGADKLTGGDGADTYDLNTFASAAVAETQTITATEGSTGEASADTTFLMNVNGELISFVHDTTAATTVTKQADEAEAALKLSNGFLNQDFTVGQAAGVLTLTFDSDLGDIANITFFELGDDSSTAARTELTGDATNGTTFTSADGNTGAAALDVASTITDFVAGDILDVAGGLTSAGAYHEGTAGTAAAGDSIIVLSSVAYATKTAATNAIDIATTGDDGIVVYLNSASGVAEVVYDVDTDIATDGNNSNVLYTLESITNLTDLAAAFTADSFVV